MIVYVDVLFLINLYVTYFELLAVCAFTHKRVGTKRMLLASAAGGAAALAIFLPPDNVLLLAVIKIAACLIITLIAFGFGGRRFIKNIMWLMLVSVVFAGVMLAVYLFFAPMKMLYINGTVYFDINLLTIIICTSAAYFLIKLVRRLLDKNGRLDLSYKVRIENLGGAVTLTALPDSGNGLVDWFSGLPVIICRKSACEDITPRGLFNCLSEYVKGARVLPYSTVGGSGCVYTFRAESIIIYDEKGKEYRVDALVGICPESAQEYDAIFNPKILV